MEKVIFNWSGGKDSAFALFKILQQKEYNPICLLTSLSEQHQRITMHGVRKELLIAQAENIGIALEIIEIPESPSMEIYEELMSSKLNTLKLQKPTASVFGDIFLQDLRDYRENKLAEVGLKGVFPLWNINTKELILDFLKLGFKTITTCVNDQYLDQSFVGRIIDEKFIADLPDNVDPCGENGEFHTFVFDGPIFKNPILFDKGEVVYRKYKPSNSNDSTCGEVEIKNQPGFYYCDLIPKS
jgi:uncharacterized protein (TIGR00290 family)